MRSSGTETLRTSTAATLLALLLTSLAASVAWAQPPVLYSHEAYQGPVRAEPDDLLLLAGDRLSAQDTVVYVAVRTASMPSQSTAAAGIAPIVSAAGAPYSLTILMPRVATRGQIYALWVRNRAGEWSNGVVINDPRALWLAPSNVYATASIAALPRQLKIVGRNLSDPSMRVRLQGAETVELQTASLAADANTIQEYVVTAALPPRLRPGEYGVQIKRSEGEWHSVPQTLRVEPDPATAVHYALDAAAYGACRPDDGRDDTQCLVRAIRAADAAGGGHVLLTGGQWDLRQVQTIVIPNNVGLMGSGANQSYIVRHWHDGKRPAATFVLMGHNVVSGLTFRESQPYRPGDNPSPMLQLGTDWTQPDRRADRVEDIVITGNVFDRAGYAISDGGLPLRRIFITHNLIGAYHTGLKLGGSRFNVAQRFRLDDSVIAHNRFVPGSHLDVPAGQGAMASEIGASQRVDFSHNIADGTATDALDPQAARGWRAGFFWHMNDSHEMVLVSLNQATCTGDKAGDGEAIAFDNNANTYAFSGAVSVVTATANEITLRGNPKNRQNRRALDDAAFYRGHWLHILRGPGIGQARRIDSYQVAADDSSVTFRISPAWDVIPRAPDSLASVGREMWQVYTIDNTIDHRTPLCRKSNRNRPRGGAIALWSEMTDSVVAGNRQYDTDGIVLHQGYRPDEPGCTDCNGWVNAKSFIEVRNNLVHGEYDWNSDCSWSGIQAQYAAAPNVVPSTVSFGITIAHNEIARADGWRGGAISMPLTWHAGPAPHRWTLIDSTLIHHNRIRDVNGPAPPRSCDRAATWERVGLKLAGSDLAWRTVTYNNSCTATPIGYRRGGYQTVSYCERHEDNSCECSTSR
jgi:methionine-rich copper-binding protein CopC